MWYNVSLMNCGMLLLHVSDDAVCCVHRLDRHREQIEEPTGVEAWDMWNLIFVYMFPKSKKRS